MIPTNWLHVFSIFSVTYTCYILCNFCNLAWQFSGYWCSLPSQKQNNKKKKTNKKNQQNKQHDEQQQIRYMVLNLKVRSLLK